LITDPHVIHDPLIIPLHKTRNRSTFAGTLSQQAPLKRVACFDPERVFDLSQSPRGTQRIKILYDTQETAYLAPLGRAITLCGIVYGKGSERKKEE